MFADGSPSDLLGFNKKNEGDQPVGDLLTTCSSDADDPEWGACSNVCGGKNQNSLSCTILNWAMFGCLEARQLPLCGESIGTEMSLSKVEQGAD